MFRKFNAILRKISIPLNIINILVGFLVGVAHVYLPLPSLFGLLLGIVMASSGTASMALSYFFTTSNTAENASQQRNKKTIPAPKLEHTRKSNLFLAFMVPMILLNSAASFFGMYTGTLLLAASLAVPFGPAAILGVAIVLATILAVGTLINSWLQTHNLWEKLKAPVPQEMDDSEQSESECRCGVVSQENASSLQLVAIPAFNKTKKSSANQGPASFFPTPEEVNRKELNLSIKPQPHHQRSKSLP